MDEQGKELLNKDFARTLLPSNFEDDPSLVEEMVNALAKDKDMKNPRPDWTFGFQRRKFPLSIGIPIPERVLNFLEIVPGMHHPFLIIEGKSFEGNMSTAENQARRGGATLVQAAWALRKELRWMSLYHWEQERTYLQSGRTTIPSCSQSRCRPRFSRSMSIGSTKRLASTI